MRLANAQPRHDSTDRAAQSRHPAFRRTASIALLVGGSLAQTAILFGCSSPESSITPQTQGSTKAAQRVSRNDVPRPEHVVIVVEENTAYEQIIDNAQAPYLNRLAANAALFTHAYGETHPSEPNYLALFSGSTHGLRDDSCPHRYSGDNLASELAAAGESFATYSQGLPRTGFTGCRDGRYARKHNPAVNWQGINVAPNQNRPFADFPRGFADLPTVALVIPDLDHDMHSASIHAGDRWLAHHLRRYANWARSHNSLLIVTWDEDDRAHRNHIATLIAGAHVEPGRYDGEINHYNILRTLEAMYGLAPLGTSAQALALTKNWAH